MLYTCFHCCRLARIIKVECSGQTITTGFLSSYQPPTPTPGWCRNSISRLGAVSLRHNAHFHSELRCYPKLPPHTEDLKPSAHTVVHQGDRKKDNSAVTQRNPCGFILKNMQRWGRKTLLINRPYSLVPREQNSPQPQTTGGGVMRSQSHPVLPEMV